MAISLDNKPESKAIGFAITLILTGIVAGTADALAAVINAYVSNEVGPTRVFQYIASGVFGRQAFEKNSMAIWGVIFHYLIATSWTFLFLLLYNRLKLQRLGIWLNSLLYGVFIWLMMNNVVLPLSNVPRGSPTVMKMIIAALILVVAVGFPISYMTSKYYKNLSSDH